MFIGQVFRINNIDISQMGQGLIETKFGPEKLPLPLRLIKGRAGVVRDYLKVLLDLNLQEVRRDQGEYPGIDRFLKT